jgi:hypothetical protein
MSYATQRFINNARISLPGSLDSVIQLEFFNVLDEFFRNTSIWQEDCDFSVYYGEPAGQIYYIEPESVSNIVRLTGVFNRDARPVKARMPTPGEIVLYSPPGQNDVYTARVGLTISDPTQHDGYPEYPEWILQRYFVGLTDGVMGRMMAQPAKPYSNANLAALHLKLYTQMQSDAIAEAVHYNVQNGQSWVFPQTFRTRGQRR